MFPRAMDVFPSISLGMSCLSPFTSPPAKGDAICIMWAPL